MKIFEHELGRNAQDKLTGFKGVLVGRIQFLTGCNRYAIRPTHLDKEGKTIDSEYFDEGRIEILKGGIDIPSISVSQPGSDDRHPDDS